MSKAPRTGFRDIDAPEPPKAGVLVGSEAPEKTEDELYPESDLAKVRRRLAALEMAVNGRVSE